MREKYPGRTEGCYPGQTLSLFSHDETADIRSILLTTCVQGQTEIEQGVGAVQLAVEILSLTIVNLGVVRERILHLAGLLTHRRSTKQKPSNKS